MSSRQRCGSLAKQPDYQFLYFTGHFPDTRCTVQLFFYIYTCTLNFPHVGCKPRPRDYYVVRPSTATSKISSYPVLSASVAERGEKLRGELIPVVTTYVWKEVPCLHDNMSSNYLSTACAQLQEPVCLHVCMQNYSEARGATTQFHLNVALPVLGIKEQGLPKNTCSCNL